MIQSKTFDSLFALAVDAHGANAIDTVSNDSQENN